MYWLSSCERFSFESQSGQIPFVSTLSVSVSIPTYIFVVLTPFTRTGPGSFAGLGRLHSLLIAFFFSVPIFEDTGGRIASGLVAVTLDFYAISTINPRVSLQRADTGSAFCCVECARPSVPCRAINTGPLTITFNPVYNTALLIRSCCYVVRCVYVCVCVCLYPVSLCVCDVCVIAVSLVCEILGSNPNAICAVNKSTLVNMSLPVKMVIFDLLWEGSYCWWNGEVWRFWGSVIFVWD